MNGIYFKFMVLTIIIFNFFLHQHKLMFESRVDSLTISFFSQFLFRSIKHNYMEQKLKDLY